MRRMVSVSGRAGLIFFITGCTPPPSVPQTPAPATTAADAGTQSAKAEAAGPECALKDSTDVEQCITHLRHCIPSFRSPSGKAPELYKTAIEQEIGQDFIGARKNCYLVIEKDRHSVYVDLCYFAFGELFFREAQTDPIKLDLAVAAYKETIDPSDTRTVGSPVPEPPADTPPFLALIGRYRLEQVFAMKGDCNKAKLYQAEIGKISGPGLDTQCARTIIANASLERAASKCAQAQ